MEKTELAKYTLTADDVSQMIGYHVQYVRALANSGKLPGLKRIRQWRFSEEEILNWLKKQTKEVTRHGRAKNSGDDFLR